MNALRSSLLLFGSLHRASERTKLRRRLEPARKQRTQTILMITWRINGLFIIRNQPRWSIFLVDVRSARMSFFTFCNHFSLRRKDRNEKRSEEYSSVFGTTRTALKANLSIWNSRALRTFLARFLPCLLTTYCCTRNIAKKQKSFFTSPFAPLLASRRATLIESLKTFQSKSVHGY